MVHNQCNHQQTLNLNKDLKRDALNSIPGNDPFHSDDLCYEGGTSASDISEQITKA